MSKRERALKSDARLSIEIDALKERLKREGIITAPGLRLQGEIIFFNNDRGWGLIESEGATYLAPIKEVAPGYKPQAGDVVSFIADKRHKKPKARNIRKVEG